MLGVAPVGVQTRRAGSGYGDSHTLADLRLGGTVFAVCDPFRFGSRRGRRRSTGSGLRSRRISFGGQLVEWCCRPADLASHRKTIRHKQIQACCEFGEWHSSETNFSLRTSSLSRPAGPAFGDVPSSRMPARQFRGVRVRRSPKRGSARLCDFGVAAQTGRQLNSQAHWLRPRARSRSRPPHGSARTSARPRQDGDHGILQVLKHAVLTGNSMSRK
jgi:hypothetical protein